MDPATRRSGVYRRAEGGLWVLHPFEPVDTVELASVGLAVPPDVLFAELDLPG